MDFLSAPEAGLRGMKDPAVLELAASLTRILVSHDMGTMPRHFQSYRAAGNTSAGVFLIRQDLDIGAAIEELVIIWQASEASDWTDKLEWLPL